MQRFWLRRPGARLLAGVLKQVGEALARMARMNEHRSDEEVVADLIRATRTARVRKLPPELRGEFVTR